jgi:hypothetical protein
MKTEYSFNDWLEENIELSPFPDDFKPGKKQYSMLAPLHLYYQKKMSKDTFDKISAKQKEAYDRAIILIFEFLKREFNFKYKQATNPKEYLEIEISKLKKEKEENITMYQYSLTEAVYYYITGSDYKRISEYWESYCESGYCHAFRLNLSSYIDIFNMHILTKKLEYLNGLNNSLNQKEQKTDFKGFQSTLTETQIKSLYDCLKGNYIDINTKIDHFKAIFRNESLPEDFIPIKRTKPLTGVLLAYFVSCLFQKDNPTDYWSIAEKCFDVRNLRQSLNNAFKYNPDNKPKGYNKIDNILKIIYSPLQ